MACPNTPAVSIGPPQSLRPSSRQDPVQDHPADKKKAPVFFKLLSFLFFFFFYGFRL